MTEVQPGQCGCGAEWATVLLRSEHGSVKVGTHCAAVLENVLKLQGMLTKRRPALEVVQRSASK